VSGGQPTTVLLISCPDKRGIVAGVAGFVYEHGGNVVDADQHSDLESGQFFMRIEFSDYDAPPEQIREELRPLVERHEMQLDVRRSYERKRVAIFVSKVDHCLVDLLWRQGGGELDAEIPLVISNHEDLAPVAARYEVPFHVFPVDKDSKADTEQAELRLLEESKIDLVVLARYMQILSPVLLTPFRHRIINIHHSFLPAFVGGNPYRQAFSRGVKLIGATAHYATEELDEGPIIEQEVIRISHRDTLDDLVRKGRDVERIALSRAVRWHLEDRILVHGNKTVVFSR
jgi:formyltetrahydrofolate deformylase